MHRPLLKFLTNMVSTSLFNGKRLSGFFLMFFAFIFSFGIILAESGKEEHSELEPVLESYLSTAPPAFTFFDPFTGLPTTSYVLDTLCPGETMVHCIDVESESTDHNITGVTGNIGTVTLTPFEQPFDSCFSYTAPFSFTGFDTVTVTVDNQLGNSGTVDIIFLITDPNTPIDAGAPQELCNVTTATLSAVDPDPYANSYWIVNSGTGILADNTAPTTTVSNLSFGNNVFIWVQEYPCGNVNFAVTQISVFDGGAPIANAGPDAFLCSDDNSYTMMANDPEFSANGVWEGISGTATVANIFDANTEVTNLGIGVNCFEWNIDNGPCPGGATVDGMCIYVYDSNHPISDAGPDQEICSSDFVQANLSGNTPVDPAVGQWDLISGTGIIDDPLQPNTFVTGCSVGDNLFTWTIDNGPCGLDIDTVVITIYDGDISNVVDAGPDAEYCSPTFNHFMSANSFDYPASGEWSSITAGVGIVDINDPNTEVTNLTIGDNIFIWQTLNGPCDDPLNPVTDTIIVTIYNSAQAVANAGVDLEFCETGLGPVTMTANEAFYPAIGTWSVGDVGTAVFADINDNSTEVTGLSIGDNELIWSIDNGVCSAVSNDTIVITVFPESSSSANAGPDQEFCTPVSTYTMQATAPLYPATGMWTLVSGFGSIVDPTDANTSINGLAPGVSVFRWTILNGPCGGGDNFDEVSITIFDDNALPAEAGPDQEVCTDPINDLIINLSGSALITPQTGTWTLVQGGGTFSDINDPNATVTNPPVGMNIYEWTVVNGPCTGGQGSDQVTITVYPDFQESADAGPDQDVCSNVASATLDANTAIFPSVGTWTVLEGTGAFNDENDPNTIVSGLSVGVNRFLWTVENGACTPNTTSDEVIITVYDASQFDVDAGADQSVCSDINSVDLEGNDPLGPATGVWQTTTTGTGVFDDPTDPNTEVTGMTIGENIFVWVITNGPCLSDITDSVSVFVFDDNAPSADAGANQNLCLDNNSTFLTAQTPIFPATGEWTLVSGSGTICR